MKKQLFFLILIQILIFQNLFSQDYYLYVSTSNERLKPNLQKEGRSNDETLNKTFRDFGVRSYYQSFPGAKTPELQSFYTIHLTESRNIDSFENLLGV